MKELVLLTKAGHIATLAFNSPENGNALDFDMYEALNDKLALCEADEDIRVVIVTGTGKHFCAGGDIRQFKERIAKMVCRVCLYRRPASVLLRTFRKDIVLYILILLLLLLFVNSFS